MRLVFKLLWRHISLPQMAGYFFANLFGMFIVLFGYQFYCDVLPVFLSEDSFMKSSYVVVSKHIGSANAITMQSSAFSDDDISDLKGQEFAKKVGSFTQMLYTVHATMGINGQSIVNSEMFFESVPDDFIDVPLRDWHFSAQSNTVPIILPRSYINMYNFGYAQSRHLPKISDSMAGLIDVKIFIPNSSGGQDIYQGRVIGFSNRLTSLLVPESFMVWSNEKYAPGKLSLPQRLLLEVKNPADEKVKAYMEDNALDLENDKLQAEKMTYFLRLVVSLVMIIGLVISLLSLYVLILSIFLLVEKNVTKLENLLLIGYTPKTVALPYQCLALVLGLVVLLGSLAGLVCCRSYYMDALETLQPDMETSGIMPSVAVGLLIWLVVSVFNYLVIRRKILRIWWRKDM